MTTEPAELRRLLLARAACAMAAGGLTTRSVAASPAAADPAGDEPFQFGFIGDTPYSRLEEGALRRVLDALSEAPLQFVLHVGDLKSSLEDCSDRLLGSRLELVGQCAHPLILTPGDNEWTDCDASIAPWQPGGQLERLDWLRRHAFGRAQSLGQRRMPLEQQGPYTPHSPDRMQQSAATAATHTGSTAGLRSILPSGSIAASASPSVSPRASDPPRLPENLRWRIGSLQCCTLHVVGSNNASRPPPALAQAWLLRQEANGAWLNDTVRTAIRQQAKGLVIALHANMLFEYDRSDGWERMRRLVIAAAVEFGGPVLLLHGDTHHFRADRLLLRSRGLANFHRVECFGSPFSSSWVQIRWDPALAFAGTTSLSNPFQVSIRSLP